MPDTVTDSKFLSRKWAIAVYLLLLAPFLRWAGLLDQAGMLTIIGSVTAGYFLVNLAQKKLATPSEPKALE